MTARLAALMAALAIAGEFFCGCLVPGHFDAGMVGKVVVK